MVRQADHPDSDNYFAQALGRTDKDTQDWEYPENHQIRQILIQTITLPKPWACRRAVRSWFDKLTTNGPRTDKDTQDWEYPENHQIRQILIQTITLPRPWACRRAVRSWFDKLGPRTDKDTQDWEYPENHQIRQILIQTITLPKPWACRRAVRSWFDKLTTNGPRTDHERTRILRIGNILKITKSGKS